MGYDAILPTCALYLRRNRPYRVPMIPSIHRQMMLPCEPGVTEVSQPQGFKIHMS